MSTHMFEVNSESSVVCWAINMLNQINLELDKINKDIVIKAQYLKTLNIIMDVFIQKNNNTVVRELRQIMGDDE